MNNLPELSRVVLTKGISDGEVNLLSGAVGTIVLVYEGGTSYEVEFRQAPRNLVLTIDADDVLPVLDCDKCEPAISILRKYLALSSADGRLDRRELRRILGGLAGVPMDPDGVSALKAGK